MQTVVIALYEGVTHLDFTGPHQFLSGIPGLEVVVASLDARPIESHGLHFAHLADLEGQQACDILCVPGGLGCVPAMEDPRLLRAVRALAERAGYVTSICTGSLILGAAGLLRGRRAACHWAWRELLREFGAIPDPARVVRDGRLITGGGVTAGIDLALSIVAELRGVEVAQAAQLLLEYAPDPPFDAGLPETAPAAVRQAVEARMRPALQDALGRTRAVARELGFTIHQEA